MISIIIPCREDAAECAATIQSICDTAGDKAEIIVIDDGSKVPLTVPDGVLLRRVYGRAGVAASRHIGAVLASNPYLFFLDAHCRLEPGWYEAAVERLESSERTLYCATCLGLTASNMDISRPDRIYNGASLQFVGTDSATNEMQFFEGKWLPGPLEDNAEMQCVMGACYLMPRRFFFEIGGLRLLHSWGSDEPFLSLKAWLAGGSVRYLKPVRVGHQFRKATTYRSKRSALFFNKLACAAALFPDAALQHFSSLMNLHCKPSADLRIAREWLAQEQRHIEVERVLGEAVFTRNLEEWLERWGVPKFWP